MSIDDVRPAWAIGLMTGTVLDGYIDVALINTDGERIERFGSYQLAPYAQGTVALLKETVSEAMAWQFDGADPEIFSRAEQQITQEQSAAVLALIEDANLKPAEVAVIGFHGQTVLHRPPQSGVLGKTRQLGDGQLMARITGVPVVNDFRSADMLAGGQGAPLSAVYHQALLKQFGYGSNTAIVNIGGVTNISWRGEDQQLVAFDTGPGNAPINDFVAERTGQAMDLDGSLAQAGTVDETRLAQLLNHHYLTQAYPKSLDRFDFTWQAAEDLSTEDGAALLTAFSAAAVGKALDLLPQRPEQLIVCGGGRHNPALMAALSRYTVARVIPAEEAGWRGDAIEAECFGFLGMRTLRALPSSFPTTTGASMPMVGGVIHRP